MGQMLRLSKQAGLFRPSHLAQIEKPQRQVFPTPPLGTLFPRFDPAKLGLGLGRKPFSAFDNTAVASLTRGYTRVADDVARQLAALRPDYFGALRHFSGLHTQATALTTVQQLAEQLQRQLRPSRLDPT